VRENADCYIEIRNGRFELEFAMLRSNRQSKVVRAAVEVVVVPKGLDLSSSLPPSQVEEYRNCVVVVIILRRATSSGSERIKQNIAYPL
jgi:hypothetical protein